MQFVSSSRAKESIRRAGSAEGFYAAETALLLSYNSAIQQVSTPTAAYFAHAGQVNSVTITNEDTVNAGGTTSHYDPSTYVAGTPVGGQYTYSFDPNHSKIRLYSDTALHATRPPESPTTAQTFAGGKQTICGYYDENKQKTAVCLSAAFVPATSFSAELQISETGLPAQNSDLALGACYQALDFAWRTQSGTGTVTCALTSPDIAAPVGSPAAPFNGPPFNGLGASGTITGYGLELGLLATKQFTFNLNCTDSGGNTASDSLRVTLTRQWPANSQFTFVTLNAYAGSSLGGIAGADAICQAAGVASGLRPGMNWKAVLNATGTPDYKAMNSLTITGPVYTPVIQQPSYKSPAICGGTMLPYYAPNGCGAILANDAADFFVSNATNGGSRIPGWKYGRVAEPQGNLCSKHTYAGGAWNTSVDGSHGVHFWRGMGYNAGTGDPAVVGSNCGGWTAAGTGDGSGNQANQGPWADGGDTAHSCSLPTKLPIQCISQIPTIVADIKVAMTKASPVWSNGPLNIVNSPVSLKWTSSGGVGALTCTVSSKILSTLVQDQSWTGTSNPQLDIGYITKSHRYDLTCTDTLGDTGTDSVTALLPNTVTIQSRLTPYVIGPTSPSWRNEGPSCGNTSGNCFGHFWGSSATCPAGYKITSVAYCPDNIITAPAPKNCSNPGWTSHSTTVLVKDVAGNGCIGHYNGNFGGTNSPTICDERWFEYCCKGTCTLLP